MNPNANLIETMKTLTFGVEIETVGAHRRALAHAVATVYPGSTVVNEGGYYDKWTCILPDGRKWTCMSDASLTRTVANGEVVTPICTWDDIEKIQEVIRALRGVGAKVDDSCGVHVHIGTPADRFNTAAIVRLAKLVYSQEALMFAALGVKIERRARYTKEVDEAFVRRLSAMRPSSRAGLAAAWYGDNDGFEVQRAQQQHYHGSRYRGLNLHSVFYRGTAEFRYFEGTLHAGQIKAYIHLCLALATKALTAGGATARRREFNPATAKYDFRVFLLRLGIIGDAFKTTRLHLMANLSGSASYKHGRPTPASTPAPAAPEAAVAPEGATGTGEPPAGN